MRAALAAALAAGAAGHPNLLECASDADTRLKVGGLIMGAPASGCYAGATCNVSVAASAAAGGATNLRLTTTGATEFVVRVADGAGALSSAAAGVAAKCDGQLYSTAKKAGSYDITFNPAAGKTAETAGLTIGYGALSGGGIAVTPQVAVMTYPATPAPAPTPVPTDKATVKLLSGKCKGVEEAEVAAAAGGTYTLRVSATGAKGSSYSCDATYDDSTGVADKECAEWLPASVLKQKEDQDITLQALDSTGKSAMCLHWTLTFGQSEEEVEEPQQPAFDMAALRAAAAGGLVAPLAANNTPATRIAMSNAILDSLTYVSHKCVKDTSHMYMSVAASAYPPQARTPLQFRLSHKLIAISSMVYSIERKCTEAWNIPPLGSCVPSVPGLPHCHTTCLMQWNLGPNGVAAHWGVSQLNHHIPSPALALGQQVRVSLGGKNGDVGCGGK